MATAYLHDFRPIPVGAPLPQSEIIAWLKGALVRSGGPAAARRRAQVLYDRLGRGTAIGRRSSVVRDFRHGDWPRMELFRGSNWRRPTLQARMAVYEKEVLRLAGRALPPEATAPDYVVQVSCTGYASPTPRRGSSRAAAGAPGCSTSATWAATPRSRPRRWRRTSCAARPPEA
ncbi:MAG: hypothetical protein M0D55_05230 [Elusimicrobiota bacterium]|nr:MAG: hypothetical protein M0D55_05230 [Elusimicrobiota bacterium]